MARRRTRSRRLAEHGAPLRRGSTMEEAVEIGLEIGKPGEIGGWLAPACASFDIVHNYEHREEC